MTSARLKADIRRRERERRYEAEDALEARTHHTRNRYGEPRHMVGWSRAEIEAWETKERAAKEAIREKRNAARMAEGPAAAKKAVPVKKRIGWRAVVMGWIGSV